MSGLPRATLSTAAALTLCLAWLLEAQTPPTAAYTLVTRDGRRSLPATTVNGQDLVALDDLASQFQVTMKEDAAAGGVTLTFRGRTIVASANQSTVSVAGKMVSLPGPIVRSGRKWLAPVEFAQTALGAIYDQRIQVRRASRLILIGDIQLPRITAHLDVSATGTRTTFDVSPATAVTTTVDAGRVVLRFDADAVDAALPAGGSGLVTQLRPGEQGNTIVVQLEAGAGAVRVTPQSSEPVSRIAIDVQPASAATAPATPPGAPAPPAAAAGPITPESLVPPRGVLRTIVIDPGHGGDDIGTRGPNGTEEKQLTLDLARRLRALLEARLGTRVVLTRDSDIAVTLDARVALANNNQGDLFLSLHGNAAPSPVVEGAEVYYLQLDREGERARDQAARGTVSLPAIGGGTRPLDLIPWDLAQAGHINRSNMLAELLAQGLAGKIPMGPSPVRRAPLRVLEGVNMPAALIEVAFLSSTKQEALARSEQFRNTAAQGLYDAVTLFRERLDAGRPR